MGIIRSVVFMVIFFALTAGTVSAAAASSEYKLIKEQYRDREVTISYPRIVGLKDDKTQLLVNNSILTDALHILKEYSAQEQQDLSVSLEYEIKWQSQEFLSIAYSGDRYVKGTLYPTRVFFTTNINLRNGSKLKLNDIVKVDETLANRIRKGNMFAITPDLTLEMLHLSTNCFLQALLSADLSPKQNTASVYSYFTSNGIGVSMGVIHAMGDYVRFEVNYQDIVDNVLASNVWNPASVRDASLESKSLLQQNVAVYFPYGPNLTWVYEGEGMEFADFTRRVMYQQNNRVQVAEDNGGARVVRGYAIDAASIQQIFSLPETDSEANFLDDAPKQKAVLLKAPLTPGAVWQDEQHRRKVISINETLTVPAGTFDNVLIIQSTALDPEQNNWKIVEYYAPGTGLIMRDFVGTDNYLVRSKLKAVIR